MDIPALDAALRRYNRSTCQSSTAAPLYDGRSRASLVLWLGASGDELFAGVRERRDRNFVRSAQTEMRNSVISYGPAMRLAALDFRI
jgi:hypothetical protein